MRVDGFDFELPPELSRMLAGYSPDRQTIGCSDAHVFQMRAEGRSALFLKTEDDSRFSELPGEAARLRWLAGQDIPCAQIVAFTAHGGRNWLLMSAVAGADLASSPDVSPKIVVRIMAGALRRLHELDARQCPFDHRLDNRIEEAGKRMQAGLVDEDDFDDERLGKSASDVFGKLLEKKPSSEDKVVTHGDACLPNFMSDGRRFTGFIDCGRLGVADRHQDLALACHSIESNLGEEWTKPFLDLYGFPEADPAKLAYYRLLDEFF